MTLDLTDDEARALAAHLKHAPEYDPFPYAPRPVESDPGEARPPKASARTATTTKTQHGATGWAWEVETVKSALGRAAMHHIM
jgi:hypothetical protein